MHAAAHSEHGYGRGAKPFAQREGPMKPKLSMTAMLIAIGMGMASKGQDAVPPPHVASVEPSTMSVVLNDRAAHAFADILRVD